MQDRRSIGQMPVLRRHLGLSAIKRHEEKFYGPTTSSCRCSHGGVYAAAMVVSMLHPVMVQQALAFIIQLIKLANSLRITVIGQHRIFNLVRDCFIL